MNGTSADKGAQPAKPRKRTSCLLVALSVVGAFVVIGLIVVGTAFSILRKDEPPPNLDDLAVVRANLPESENAMGALLKASEVMDEPDETETTQDWFMDTLNGKAEWDAARVKEVLDQNAPMFGSFDEALDIGRLEVPEVVRLDQDLSYFARWRTFARLAVLRALQDQKEGHDAQAFDRTLEVVKFGHMIEDSGGAIIHYLVGSAVKRTGLKGVGRLLERTSLTSEKLLPYAERLAAYESNQDGLANALRVEFQSFSNIIGDFLAPAPNHGELKRNEMKSLRPGFLFKPNETRRLYADLIRIAIWNASHPPPEWRTDVPEEIREVLKAKDQNSAPWRSFMKGNPIGKTLSAMTGQALERIKRERCSEDFQLRATRILIAMKCYKIDRGSLPESLDALVPDYLPSVPLDPFDERPLGYSPEKKELRARTTEDTSSVVVVPF